MSLVELFRNYSGFSVDFGACEECGKAYQISYKIDNMVQCPDWNIPSREETEKAAAKKPEPKKSKGDGTGSAYEVTSGGHEVKVSMTGSKNPQETVNPAPDTENVE